MSVITHSFAWGFYVHFSESAVYSRGAVERKLLERDQCFLQKATLFNQFVPHTIHYKSADRFGIYLGFHILADGFNGTGT